MIRTNQTLRYRMSLLLRYDLPRAGSPTWQATFNTPMDFRSVNTYGGDYDLSFRIVRLRDFRPLSKL